MVEKKRKREPSKDGILIEKLCQDKLTDHQNGGLSLFIKRTSQDTGADETSQEVSPTITSGMRRRKGPFIKLLTCMEMSSARLIELIGEIP